MLENTDAPCPTCDFEIKNYVQSKHQLKPQTILNEKYLVGRVLGEDGSGITYLGWDLNLEIKIVIREYYPHGLATREAAPTGTATVIPLAGEKGEIYGSGLDKFVNDAKSFAKFYTLPGIVAVKDFFRGNGTAYIVMEFVNGITLEQYLSNNGGRVHPNQVFELMRPLMKSLSQIHAGGIIHRDIAPDNIMVTNKGDVKLLCFGAAGDCIADADKSPSPLKPGYAAEEQYRTKGQQGPWTDVYALCATIYKMITGITPPESQDRFNEDKLVRPSQMATGLSAQAENALLKGLSIFQKDRYQSIVELYNNIYGATQTVENVPPSSNEERKKDVTVTSATQVNKEVAAASPAKVKKGGSKILPIAIISAVLVVLGTGIALFALLFPKTGGNTPSVGNTSGNIANQGMVAQQGDWVYYSNKDERYSLCKMRTDGKENTKLNKNTSFYINVAGDWIYYSDDSDNGTLYKIRTDGTQNTKLNNEKTVQIHTAGNWIYYYLDDDTSTEMFKIRTDGKEQQRVGEVKQPEQPKYTGETDMSKFKTYSDENISFEYPKELALSKNENGYPMVKEKWETFSASLLFLVSQTRLWMAAN